MDKKTKPLVDDGVARTVWMLKNHSGFSIGAITGQLLKLDVHQVRHVGELIWSAYPNGSIERRCFTEAIKRVKVQRSSDKHMGQRSAAAPTDGRAAKLIRILHQVDRDAHAEDAQEESLW